MRSLSWKLGGALLLVVLVSVGLMAFITNLNTAREFRQYVSQGNAAYLGTVESTISRLYSQSGWSNIQQTLTGLVRSGNDRLVVADNSGTIVGDTDRTWLGQKTGTVGLTGGNPITVSGKEVGKVYLVSAGMGMMGRGIGGGHMNNVTTTANPDQAFLDQVNSNLWMTGLIAALVAIVVGLVLTRQITSPVRALTRGAGQISRGDLAYRVKIKSKDELGELATSFNAMAQDLERSEQTRRRLIQDIAHELRTPLTVIEGTVNGMLDGVFKPDKEHLTSIKEETVMLTRLIGDLRDLSLAESGRLKLERTSTDISALLRRKLSQMEVQAAAKNIKFNLDVKSSPEAMVDPGRIEQVIANLLANAIRHTPSGGSITVGLESLPDGSRYGIDKNALLISVSDTGEGISAEHISHMFERFYRVETSRSRAEGGAGLGLAIVKQMVEAHGGKVWVESAPGKGASFFIVLPAMNNTAVDKVAA